MKPFARFTCVFVTSLPGLMTASCGDGEEGTWDPPDDTGQQCGAFVDRPTAALFESKTVPEFALSLPAGDWAWLNQHALEEAPVEARLSFQGEDVGPVGLRFKGAHGTLDLCLGANGELLCPKLSMKLDFSHIFPDCRFYRTREVNLHSMQWDPTKLHERLAYELYRELKVQAPRSAWANVTVNGESLGIFSLVEEIDQAFVDANWPKQADGDLYKEAWPKNALPTYYHSRLVTEPNRAKVDAFLGFYEALTAAGQDGQALSKVLAARTDKALLSRYMAVDDALINWDGVTTFYVTDDDSWTGNHNYFWYRRPKDDKFQLIPWDLDGTWSLTKSIANAPRWNEAPKDCSQKYVEFGGDARVVAPGCNPIFTGLAADRDAYFAAIDELLAGPFSVATLESKIDAAAAFIDAAVNADPRSNYAAFSVAVDQLRDSLPQLHERLTRIRRDESIKPLQLQLDENAFEDTSAFAVAAGLSASANPASSSKITWGVSEASGSHCLRQDFELRNESLPWQQWVKFGATMALGTADVSAFQGLRIVARADRVRTYGVQIVSPAQSRASEGIQNGWENLRLSPAFSTFELLFADATIPSWAADRASDAGAPLKSVLTQIGALEFLPACALCSSGQGFIPEPGVDVGFIEIDSVTFF